MSKNFLAILLFALPLISFGQTEREQKIQKVQENRTSSSPVNNNTTTNYNQGYQSGYQNGYNDGVWRDRYRTPYYYNPYDVGYYPYWNTRRTWDRREYVMTTDPNLVQRNPSKPMRLSFGVITERDLFQYQISPYLISGGESFWIIQYHMTLPLMYPYYDNIETWEVQAWEDGSAGGVETKYDFSIGGGRTINRFSPFATAGIASRKKYDAYYDETFILSSINQNGIYLINQQRQVNMSVRAGILYHWEFLELLIQLRFDGRVGVGFGAGIKL